MSANNAPKTRKRIITIRHATPSRRKIVFLVTQSQDALGNWLTPIITFDGPIIPMLESGRYARDLGIALIVSAYFYDEMMLHVKNSEAEMNVMTDLSIEDEDG